MTTSTRPRALGKTRPHLELVRTMARATGADLQAAFDDGRLSAEAWADTIQRCRGCSDPKGCRKWLSRVEWGAQTPPDMCRNAELMKELAADAMAVVKEDQTRDPHRS
ncbi:DUF6455 family protein [Jannaschia aquimarina]|uniref:DUF6455 domain-containing protein n=1 Tax=Jannaschia aquimarina TaxID=935700 RepID=A0A0D1D938_9RHOB|nr:DUF6455 family protein [Jannaschia aquimarina]KIT16418.1 hypothetical protein jaqu_18050 [Jannaschia aquimarina]SNS91812.1 hypothetical protein SAMN05421775_103305 [Jannaschia aquimarina]